MIEYCLKELIAERDKLDRVIAILSGSAKRRGGPRKTAAVTVSTPVVQLPKLQTSKRWTVAQRKAQGARMRHMWKSGKFRKSA